MKEKEKNYLKDFASECTLPLFDKDLYAKYDVKRGLRDINGKGVVAGLTMISDVSASKIVDGKSVPADGELYYRGYPIEKLVEGCLKDKRFGFEETTYLLLTGKLPKEKELADFKKYLTSFYTLPKNFVRDIIMKSPSEDMMNTLIRSVLCGMQLLQTRRVAYHTPSPPGSFNRGKHSVYAASRLQIYGT